MATLPMPTETVSVFAAGYTRQGFLTGLVVNLQNCNRPGDTDTNASRKVSTRMTMLHSTGRTHSNPKANRPQTSIFRFLVICSIQTILSGRTKMQTSTKAFRKLPIHGPRLAAASVAWHLIGSSQRSLMGCGLHSERKKANSRMQYASTAERLTHQLIRNQWLVRVKIRRYNIRTEVRAAVIAKAHVI